MLATLTVFGGTNLPTGVRAESVSLAGRNFDAHVMANGIIREPAATITTGRKATVGEESAQLDINLDGEALDNGCGEQNLCRAVIRFLNNRTAVVHFSLRVDGEKVTAKLTAGRRHGETIKTVNVPVWSRTHLAGKE